MGSQDEPPGEQVSILGPTLRFKGELHADEDLLIRGRVEGSITHSQRLTVSHEGRVKADIKGQVIVVEGTVEGDLNAATSVKVTETGHLTGDVSAPSVNIVEGATFNGSVVMDAGKTAQSSRQSDSRPAQSPEAARGASGAGVR